ncbi:MAG: hypothetical protein ACK5M8_19070, partial [Shewanella algae]
LAPMDGALGRVLLAYVALFRPAKSDLSWKRALRLTQETLSLSNNRDWLRAALMDTVQKLREARRDGVARPLTNHNYLKKVLASINEGALTPVKETSTQRAKPGLEIKSFGRPESLAETQARHQAFIDGLRKSGGNQ